MRAALFDVFGTVVDWRSVIARDVARFLGEQGIGEIAQEAFADA